MENCNGHCSLQIHSDERFIKYCRIKRSVNSKYGALSLMSYHVASFILHFRTVKIIPQWVTLLVNIKKTYVWSSCVMNAKLTFTPFHYVK